MITVDNFKLIGEHLYFANERSVYFIQVIKRKKENPDMHGDSLSIDSFYVHSINDLNRFMPHIIQKCKDYNARAYIKMNCLDAQSVMLEQIAEITRVIRDGRWNDMPRTLNSACGKCGKQLCNEKYYLVDIDENRINDKNEIENYIESLTPINKEFVNKKVKLCVPTLHGMHLITTGFNIQAFRAKFPDIDVHDDCNTILYYFGV